MADILICGMDKPFNCFACDLSYLRGERLFCCVTKDEVIRYKIASDCPLHELPEHGDLIDADSLADDLNYDVELAATALDDMSLVGTERDYLQSEKDIKQNCAYYVKTAPVVIPATKEESK